MADQEKPKRLRVVDGGESPKPYARKSSDEAEQIVCRVCEIDIGVASSMFVEVDVAPMELKGEIVHTNKGLVCVMCLARGKITQAM